MLPLFFLKKNKKGDTRLYARVLVNKTLGWDNIIQKASHKYIKRIATGNPKRPWSYIYKESEEANTNSSNTIQGNAKSKSGSGSSNGGGGGSGTGGGDGGEPPKDDTRNLKNKALKKFDNPTEKVLEVPYTRDEYNKLFPEGKIETPIEIVKMGEHQFERIGTKDEGARKQFLGAMWQTLKRPITVIDDVDNKGRTAKLYIKSFVDRKPTMAIVTTIDGIPVSVSFGPRKTKQVRNKIEMTASIHYVEESSQVASIPKNEGGSPTTEPVESLLPVSPTIPPSTKKSTHKGEKSIKKSLFFIYRGRLYARVAGGITNRGKKGYV